jgi:hypothetical protein
MCCVSSVWFYLGRIVLEVIAGAKSGFSLAGMFALDMCHYAILDRELDFEINGELKNILKLGSRPNVVRFQLIDVGDEGLRLLSFSFPIVRGCCVETLAWLCQ